MLLSLLAPVLTILLPPLCIFLILLILVQRGRGGGLVGAFGGGGGQSAFGAKAGDLFTKITIVAVSAWLVVCILLLLAMKHGAYSPRRGSFEGNDPPVAPISVPVEQAAPAAESP